MIWLHPNDCRPPHGLDLLSQKTLLKIEYLVDRFVKNNFDSREPALVGYPLDGKIQLLSGTHRHFAAKRAEVLLPVTLWLRSDIEKAWGTDNWKEIMRDIPVELDK